VWEGFSSPLEARQITDIVGGLVKKTNNEGEALALLKGCQSAWDKGIHSIQVFGDLVFIIKSTTLNYSLRNNMMDTMLKRIELVKRKFTKFEAFHILRNLNGYVDGEENKGATQDVGALRVNDLSSTYHPVP